MIRLFLILILLSGCASNKANRKLKRAERLTQQAIELGAKVTPDTVYKKVPVFINSVRVDSIFVTQAGDTVRIEVDRLKIKFIDLPGDSVFIEGKCDSLTVIKEVPILVTKEIKTGLGVLIVVQWSLLALIIGAVLARIFWK